MTWFQPNFTHSSAAVRVRFGAGIRREVLAEVEALGAKRAMVVATPGKADLAEKLGGMLGSAAAGICARAVMHTPVDVSESATKEALRIGADCIVAIGGGSAIGLGKAIAYRTGLPQIAIPTTYAGSECTAILGQTEGGRKTTLSDPKVRPRTILYDPELLVGLPPAITATSGMNAIAHAVEALYAANRTPLASMLAAEGMAAFQAALPRSVAAPDDLAARGETLYAAWLCGSVLGQVGMALHHKLCHTLGGSFGLPHAETHAVILPHATAFNARAVPELLAPVSAIFEAPPGTGLHAFARELGAPVALKDLGLAEADLDRAADLATQTPYPNPAPVERAPVRALLQAAWEGRAPG